MRWTNCFLIVFCTALFPATTALTTSTSPHIPNPFGKKKVSRFAQFKSYVRPGISKRRRNNTTNKNAIKPSFNFREQAQNLLAGLASAIALIPEASTFAMTAGLSPLVGLGSTVVLATCSGLFGGRPGLVSGASATVSMILKPLCEKEGHLVVSLAVIMAGLIQVGLGMTRCARYIRVVPRPVMLGFVNGLAIKVVAAQIPHFQHPHGVWLQGATLKWHSILVAASALIIEFFPKIFKGSILPSPLVALGLAALSAETFNLPVPKLVDIVGQEAFQGGIGTLLQAMFPFASTSMEGHSSLLPPFGLIVSLEKIWKALPTAIEMAVVGLLQSLLTLQIVDEMTLTRGKNTKESIAQGLGNIMSGSIGGMGGSALLGQSLVNVRAGGTGRLSSVAVALFVMAGVSLFAPVLGVIPVAALVGLMLTVAQHTFSWAIMKDIAKGQVPRAEIMLMVAVTLTTAFVNMAAAVGLGVLVSALRFAWQASCDMSAKETGSGTQLNNRLIHLRGPLFFGSALTFQSLCEPSMRDRETADRLRPRFELAVQKRQEKHPNGDPSPLEFSTGRETIIDFTDSQVWDHAAVMAIEATCKQYHELGVKLHLRHLSPDCREKLLEGSDVGEWSTEFDIDPSTDPSYLVGVDPRHRAGMRKYGTEPRNNSLTRGKRDFG
eukprot:scaffold781_cov132-Cylindrotheca_fusiformis.AAC.15